MTDGENRADGAKVDASGEEKKKIPGYPNLRVPTTEEAREMGRLGGKRSAAVRKRRKTMAEALDEYLSARLQPSHPRYAEIKRMLRTMGLLGDGEEPDNQMLLLAGMMQRAQKDPTAAAFVRDTVGERPTENIAASIDAPPPVVIGIHDPAWIANERRRQEVAVAEMRRMAIDVNQPEIENRAEGREDAPESLGEKGDTSPVPDARTQHGASGAASERFHERPPTEPAENAKEGRHNPPPPARPVDPNVCLPSKTPPK